MQFNKIYLNFHSFFWQIAFNTDNLQLLEVITKIVFFMKIRITLEIPNMLSIIGDYRVFLVNSVIFVTIFMKKSKFWKNVLERKSPYKFKIKLEL